MWNELKAVRIIATEKLHGAAIKVAGFPHPVTMKSQVAFVEIAVSAHSKANNDHTKGKKIEIKELRYTRLLNKPLTQHFDQYTIFRVPLEV